MIRRGLAGVIVVACLAGMGLWVSLPTGSTPRVSEPSSLTVTPEVVEVTRTDRETAVASVELRNASSQTIHIDKLETSCHCTSVDAIEHMGLAPGQATTLKLNLQLPGDLIPRISFHFSESSLPSLNVPLVFE